MAVSKKTRVSIIDSVIHYLTRLLEQRNETPATARFGAMPETAGWEAVKESLRSPG
jgi:hypothetical protein